MKRIFISHASKDKEIVQAFMEDILDVGLGIDPNDIFCSSIDGAKIPSGNDWRDEIKKGLEESKITFLIVSPNYKESEMCLYEMGAAWVLSAKVIPLLVEPITFDSVSLLYEIKQVEKLQDEKSLDRVKDGLQRDLEIPRDHIKSDRWTSKKHEFLEKLNKHLVSNPFEAPVTREALIRFERENAELTNAIQMLLDEKGRLEKINEELKNAKDKEEVVVVEEKYLNREKIEEFKSLCGKVKKLLSPLASIVRGIIYADYSGKSIAVNLYNPNSAVEAAIAKDIINADMLVPNWDDTKTMRDIYSALEALGEFIAKNDEDENFISAYEIEFDTRLSLSNLDFWEEVIGVSISLE